MDPIGEEDVNEPAFVPYVIEKIAEIKGVSPEEAERASWENGCRLFRIDPGPYKEK